MDLMALLKFGGVTIVILIGCSVFSIAIIIERMLYFKERSKIKRVDFMSDIGAEIKRGNIMRALESSKETDTPFSQVVYSGLKFYGHSEAVISNAMEREITIETNKLEHFITITGTIGSVAVYIGLFGTVMGIIRAFNDISASGAGGLSVVINGIAEALICTAAGLAVAVPAVIFYNYFVKKINDFVADMELCASEIMDLIQTRSK